METATKNGHTAKTAKKPNRLGDGVLSEFTVTPTKSLAIPAPKFHNRKFKLVGDAPYVQCRFSVEALHAMRDKQSEGSTASVKKGKRAPRDFDALYEQAMYLSTDGWHGIPASVFRSAIISACRLVGFKMTLAKLAVFCEADGFDAKDGTPLIRITKGKPKRHEGPGRNASGGMDIRVRPMWEPGWEAMPRIRYDSEVFTEQDIANLLMRVGQQVGIGCGRPDSTDSAGCGWGTFTLGEF